MDLWWEIYWFTLLHSIVAGICIRILTPSCLLNRKILQKFECMESNDTENVVGDFFSLQFCIEGMNWMINRMYCCITQCLAGIKRQIKEIRITSSLCENEKFQLRSIYTVDFWIYVFPCSPSVKFESSMEMFRNFHCHLSTSMPKIRCALCERNKNE